MSWMKFLFLLPLLIVAIPGLRAESTEHALLNAIEAGDLAAVSKAIGEGAWVDWRDIPNATTPLVTAIESGNLAMVERLIAAGASVRFPTSDGRQPLVAAVEEGDPNIVNALVAAGAGAVDLGEEDGFTLSQRAVRNRQFEIARILVKAGVVDISQRDDFGNTLPMLAANAIHQKHRYLEPLVVALAQEIERSGLPWNAENNERKTLADAAAAFQLPELLAYADRDFRYRKLLQSMKAPPYELHVAQAIENNDRSGLAWLLKQQEPDWEQFRQTFGFDPLARATQLNRVELAILLIQHGNPFDGLDQNGEGVFTLAARAGVDRVVLALLARGAQPDQIDAAGGSGLHGAALAGRLDWVRRFVERHDADVNKIAAGGVTPLIAAAYSGNTALVRYLVKRGANPAIRDAESRAAIDIAAAGKRIGMVRLLAKDGEYEELLANYEPRPESPFIGYWSNDAEAFERFALHLRADGTGQATIGFGVQQPLFWKTGSNYDGELVVQGTQGSQTMAMDYEVGPNRVLITNPQGQQLALRRSYASDEQFSEEAYNTPGRSAMEAWVAAGRPASGPDLSGLGLERLPSLLFLEPAIRRLDVSRNRLKTISESINQMTHLEEFAAEDNQLWSLPVGLMRLRHLRKVELSANRLTFLPNEFSGWRSLEYLDLSNNHLRQLPSAMASLQSVRDLSLRDNRLISLPNAVAGWANLMELDASHNALSALPSTFRDLDKVEKVMLMSNHFTEFPRELYGAQRLRVLSLRNNRIRTIPPGISGLSRLEILDLSFNRLQELPPELYEMRELRALDLSGNPDLDLAKVRALQEALPRAVIGYDKPLTPPAPAPTPGPPGSELPPRAIVIEVD